MASAGESQAITEVSHPAVASATGKAKGILFIVENLPSPFDRRVWQEATSLAAAGYEVSIICPTGKGHESREVPDKQLSIRDFSQSVSSCCGADYQLTAEPSRYKQRRDCMELVRQTGYSCPCSATVLQPHGYC